MALGQIITGIINNGRARKMRKKGEGLEQQAYAGRTDFEIPQEIEQNLALAKNEAFGKPALQSQLENIAASEESANLSAVNRYATSGADALAAAAGVSQRTSQSRQKAVATGQEVRQQNMQTLYQAGNNLADYRSMQWDLNVNIPFLQRLQFAQQLQGAGYQGQNDAINSIGRGLDDTANTLAKMALGA